jgi:hypothetical protein
MGPGLAGTGRKLALAVLLALAAWAGNFSRASAQESIIGTWQGLYECPQGVTGLTLTIAGSARHNLTGTFRFYATPENSRPTNGAYEVSVTFDPASKRFEARGTRWIDQPDGYMFATLRGVLQGRQLIGTVENEGCGAFELNRTGQ